MLDSTDRHLSVNVYDDDDIAILASELLENSEDETAAIVLAILQAGLEVARWKHGLIGDDDEPDPETWDEIRKQLSGDESWKDQVRAHKAESDAKDQAEQAKKDEAARVAKDKEEADRRAKKEQRDRLEYQRLREKFDA